MQVSNIDLAEYKIDEMSEDSNHELPFRRDSHPIQVKN